MPPPLHVLSASENDELLLAQHDMVERMAAFRDFQYRPFYERISGFSTYPALIAAQTNPATSHHQFGSAAWQVQEDK